MGMVKLTIKWNKQTFEVDLDQSDTVDTFQTQIYTLTNVTPGSRAEDLGFQTVNFEACLLRWSGAVIGKEKRRGSHVLSPSIL